MKEFLLTALATAFGNIVVFLMYQGFVKSAIGRNFREEITRWFDQINKLIKGNKR